VSPEGILKRKPCTESREVLPEAGKDYEGPQIDLLETMKKAKFDVMDNKVIDLKSKTLKHNILS
jgi:hypothetical protein